MLDVVRLWEIGIRIHSSVIIIVALTKTTLEPLKVRMLAWFDSNEGQQHTVVLRRKEHD